ncbi:exo-beta-N-acetylmuramidase NamZ family protein [Thalassobellus citreus]|uniref:exo-beta-N-acetylmuramidase NamZ family protein n=1 Tax=Thalassobellus citreus TaxID=3367752 RepID=UPI00378E9D75
MRFNIFKNTVLLFVLVMISCANLSKSEAGNQNSEVTKQKEVINEVKKDTSIIVGANQTTSYLRLLKGKQVGIVANQTSVIFKQTTSNSAKPNNKTYTHLVDSLTTLNINIKTVFAPEHGFRGTADAGEHVKDGIDTKTQLPIVSLYGKNKKPSPEQLKNIDVIIFDIQDVGARFYTYISSLHYVMEACAEANIPVIILDRPNPNGHYIDGPILETEHSSFVGMHPIPVVHGMTIGEYAQMINGEKWLANGIQCELNVISLKNYNHNLSYSLPIYPSPNLPKDKSINLYPSLCFFEGTNVSAGRGTKFPFQIFGSPFLNAELYDFEFTPQPNFGSKYPKHQDKLCFGKNLILTENLNTLNLRWLIEAYNNTKNKDVFFNAFFTKLAGTKKLQQQIETGLGEAEIKATWQEGLKKFRKTRAKYLIYKNHD